MCVCVVCVCACVGRVEGLKEKSMFCSSDRCIDVLTSR